MKTALIVLGILVVLAGAYFLVTDVVGTQPAPVVTTSVANIKDLEFKIGADTVKLTNGVSSVPAAPGSASMVVTRYFGNEAVGDINSDGVPDVSFLVTQGAGGSGTFFYLVGAIKDAAGYHGTQAMLIGDRIAPQTTEYKMLADPYGARVIVNYADRKPGEPMTTQPSVGKSLYAKYDPGTNSFGEVVQNFEGESAK